MEKKLNTIKLKEVFITSILCLICFNTSYARNYYLDNSAQSNGNGTTFNNAWNIVRSVNNSTFHAGDTIFIKRTGIPYTTTTPKFYASGPQITGLTGVLSPQGSGGPNAPITIDAYGPPENGNPVIDAKGSDHSAGILLYNQDYWTINHMQIVNNSSSPGYRWGILVYYSPQNTGTLHKNIKINNNYIHNIYGTYIKSGNPSIYVVGGIYVWVAAGVTSSYNSSTSANNRIDGVCIENNTVENITGTGIFFRGEGVWDGTGDVMNWNNLSKNVVIRGNRISNTCDGIITMGIDNPLIEKNVVNRAGGTGVSGTDPTNSTVAICGIWTTCSRSGLIQYNEVMNTLMLPGDGQPLHTDTYQSGTCIFQYNYTHSNQGGFITAGWPVLMDDQTNKPHVIVRYNISQNDQNDNGAGFISLGNGGDEFYNNTIYSTRPITFYTGSHSCDLDINNNCTGIYHPPYPDNPKSYFRNNIFNVGGIVSILGFPAWDTDDFEYDHNCYYGISNLPSNESHAVTTNPNFFNTNAGAGGFRLKSNSPCINAGIKIENKGGHDFWGVGLYNNKPEIGAYEVPNIIPISNLLLNN